MQADTGTATGARDETAAASGAVQVRRPPNRWKVIFVTLLVLGFVGTTVWVLLGSRLLVVRHVEVSGTRLLTSERVVAAGRIPLGSPMVALDTAAIRRRIEQLPQVESARVGRAWPGTVRIAVTERVPVVLAPAPGGRFAELDRAGVTVLVVAARPDGLPDLVVGTPGPADPATLGALTAFTGLPGDFAKKITAVEAQTPESITFRMAGGVTIVWGAAERAPEKLRLITALTRSAAGRSAHTIDVSSPEVVTTQ